MADIPAPENSIHYINEGERALLVNDIVKRLQNKLAEGEVDASSFPPEYLELERIIPPDSKEGRIFQAQMEAILARVLPEYDDEKKRKRPIHFVLSDHKKSEYGYENGYIVTTDKGAVICLDKGLFESFKQPDGSYNLNQLAYVLLHEMTHMKLDDLLGSGNSNLHETACDLRPLIKMAEAGLSMEEAKVWMEKRADPIAAPFWQSALGVHPLPWYRADAMETGLGAVRSSRGTEGKSEGKAVEAIPAPLMDVIKNSHHVSFIERTLHAAGFEQKSAIDKLTMVEKLLPELQPDYFVRIDDIRPILDSLKIPPEKRKACGAICQRMMDKLLDHFLAFDTLYEPLDSLWQGHITDESQKHYPQGRISSIASDMGEILDVMDAGDSNASRKVRAQTAAKHLMQVLETIPDYKEIDWDIVKLPALDLQDTKTYRRKLKEARAAKDVLPPPWHDMVPWTAQEPSSPLRRALWAMGIVDPLLLIAADPVDLEWFNANVKGSGLLSVPTSEDNLGLGHFTFNKYGHIVKIAPENAPDGDNARNGITDYAKDVKLAYSRKLMTAPRKKSPTGDETHANGQDDMLHQTLSFISLPPKEFFANRDAYLAENKDFLVPAELMTFYKTTTAFHFYAAAANQLVGYFKKMLAVEDESERQAYRQFIHDFFLGKTSTLSLADFSSPVDGPEIQRIDKEVSLGQEYSGSNNPFYHFLANDKSGLFTFKEKIHAAQLSGFSDKVGRKLVRQMLGYEQPQTMKAMTDCLSRFDSFQSFYRKNEDAQGDIHAIGALELQDFIIAHGKNKTLWPLLANHADILRLSISGENVDANHEARTILLDYIAKENHWPEDIKTLSTIYRTLEYNNLFPDATWHARFAEGISRKMKAMDTPDKRIAAAEAVLFGDHEIADVSLRRAAISQWVASCAKKYGKDNGSETYYAALAPLIKRVGENAPINLRYEMFQALGNAVVSQRQTSYAMEKAYWGTVDRTHIHPGSIVFSALQIGIDQLSQNNEERMLALKFLIKPLTKQSLKEFGSRIGEILIKAKEAPKSSSQTWSSEASIRSLKDNPERFHALCEMECKHFYENFWQAPAAARLILMKTLLLPSRERAIDRKNGTDKTFNEACELVIRELLPDNLTDEKQKQYVEPAREMLRAFLAPGVLDDKGKDNNLRGLFISALMSSVERTREANGEMRIGQRLAALLEMMGPAWKKLGQAISSHPDTPRDIAEDMEPLKGKSDMPRWQMWSLYEQTVPEPLRKQHPILGPVLGSASFFTAVDAGDSIFSMQAPYAKERAEDGFSIMEKFVAELQSGNYKIGAAVPGSIADMVKSARASAALETTARVGVSQAKAMARQHNDTHIEIAGKTYDCESAVWYDVGPEFRRMKKMPGPVFNLLPEQKKHDAAKAKLAEQLRDILSGDVLNPDQHGRNFCVDKMHLGDFDTGAIHAVVKDRHGREVTPEQAEKALAEGGTVEIPHANATGGTAAEKAARLMEMKQLGEAMLSAFKSLTAGIPAPVAIHQEIDKARRKDEPVDFLIRVERALLALNDCYKHLDGNGQDIIDIFAGLYRGNHIHEAVRVPLEEASMGSMVGQVGDTNSGAAMLNKFFDNSVKENVVIHHAKAKDAPEPQWWDMPKNKQDFPSLCAIGEVLQKEPDSKKTPGKKKRLLAENDGERESNTSLPSSKRNHLPIGSYMANVKQRGLQEKGRNI